MADEYNNSNNQAGEEREEKKPAAEHVNLKVVGSDGAEVFFKIKRTTQLKKLMETYCERQGKSFSAVRFLVDGERIQPHQTPDELQLDDGDQIEVMIEQLGGR
ncbi:SUMO protein smt3 [Savitreella phatthalungensis]